MLQPRPRGQNRINIFGCELEPRVTGLKCDPKRDWQGCTDRFTSVLLGAFNTEIMSSTSFTGIR